jgi:hypothetical protein
VEITVNVPDELVAEAEARGITAETFIRSLIENATRSSGSHQSPPKPDLESFFHEMAAHTNAILQLPDEAFTREGIYQDHD